MIIIKATEEHAIELSQNLKQADLEEVLAGGHTPLEVLLCGVKTSLHAYSAIENGKVLAMWGINVPHLLGNEASVWLLTAPHIKKRTLLKESRRFVDYYKQQYPHLMGMVYAPYKEAIKLLLYLGFDIHTPVKYGRKKAMFSVFELRH